MIFKDIEFNEEEIIESLKDAGIEVFSPGDAEFNNHPTIKEQMDWIETRLRAINALFRVVSELDAREFSSNCVVSELHVLSWNDVCDQGIALLQELKNGWKEIKMICNKCTNTVCKVYHGTCRRFRFLRFITFGRYGRR